MTECLIVFTRYPEPGKAKTRLIPALGAEGAANLHRQLAAGTMKAVKMLQAIRPVKVIVCYTGGSLALMQAWLGSEICYQVQREGDLGQRMAQALQAAFADGSDRAVIIGTDCPSLNSQILEQAFQALAENQLAIGGAIDGGYYLIGLQQLIPELFSGISWSTDKVLRQTLEIAAKLQLSVAQLPVLADIDRPEDLLNVVS